MVTRLTSLTDEQRARMPSYAQEWTTRALDTGPVDWGAWEVAARRCYDYAGVPWPGVVVRVPSPLVGALAAPIAAYLIHRGAVGGAVRTAVDGAVHRAVSGAVDGAVHGAVGDAVSGAVNGAVDGAVDDAVRQLILQSWYQRLGGQWWAAWPAYAGFFRDVTELDMPGDTWDRSRVYEAASTAGWWWPRREFVMVSERPREIHLERVGPDGWGSHRLHNEAGPSIAWAGWELHHWHGTQVPRELIRGEWDTARILREPNSEVRRAAIERMGWDRFIADARLRRVGEAVPDPGNPGYDLTLWDVPERIYGDQAVRVLLCTNGTVERDGTRRRFGLTVPAEIRDPLAAAAWGYDDPDSPVRMTADLYATIVRRT